MAAPQVAVGRVTLREFRSYERAELEVGPGLTVISGSNGAGKTNLLEAIYFGLTGRSCRTSNEREVVRHGARVARVAAETEDDAGSHLIEVGFEHGRPKRLRVDGALVERLGEAAPRPLVSVFLPERLELVKGAPSTRRSHLDSFVAALWPARADARSAYARALAQRNALIARVRAGLARVELLDPWDGELARHGSRLMADRDEATALVTTSFASRAAELGLPGSAELRYRPRAGARDVEGLRAELAARREPDVARGFSGHGPHRDELELRHDGRGLRAFGSQGQQRLALLALLLAERDALTERGQAPLLLFDDVMSELDALRRERLAASLREVGQAIVTATDAELVTGAGAGAGAAVVHVEAGNLTTAGTSVLV